MKDRVRQHVARAPLRSTIAEAALLRSLMKPVYEPGRIASWITPPTKGINEKPFDYEYVHVA